MDGNITAVVSSWSHPQLLQSFVPLGWGLELGFCARGRARLPPLAGGRTGAWEFTEPLLAGVGCPTRGLLSWPAQNSQGTESELS